MYTWDDSEFEPSKGDPDWAADLLVTNMDNQAVPLIDRIDCDHVNCLDPAAGYYRHMCCNTVVLACTGHCNGILRYLLELNQRGNLAKCIVCARFKPPLMLITHPQPLGLTD